MQAARAMAGITQPPVEPAPKGSGIGVILLAGGILFLLAIAAIAFFVVLPLLDETPGSSVNYNNYPTYASATDDDDLAGPSPASPAGSPEQKATPVATAATRVTTPSQRSSPADAGNDPVIGSWDLGSTGMVMEFGSDGTAILSSPATGYHARGTWVKISPGNYRLSPSAGSESQVLILDPLAGLLHAEDYSAVFSRKD
jgi:hypothetical protein